ncbi:hypothetical protein GCM10007352_09680 [Mucilaginibacter phyllosphaerae]|nr:hypothetical protein GCM10007352_09680 [Mucilaginibacter phyllosphaerae]
MCTKKVNKIEKPLNPETGQTTQTPGQNTGTADPSADPSDDEVRATYAIGECTYTVQPSQWVVDGANIPAGSVVCIPAGTRGALLFKNLKGTETAPIVIMNKGGKVNFTVAATASYALKTQNCRYFKILGIGDAATKYGFNVNGGNISVTLDDLSSDFEISFVEVRNSGFAGIMAKTDPSCDIATQRGHFTMKNISLHHNYVHKTGGEGFYVGNSFYADGRPLACGTVLPHDVVNVKIYKNMIDSAGCEGIQVGSAIAGCEVYKNTIRMPGLSPFANGQDNGIQIGEGTGGVCYANLIEKAPGDGIIVLGLGDNLVYNNIILNAGEHGIFADSRYTPGPNFKFINNTIISPALNGVKLNSETIPMNTVINNVIISPGAGVAIARKSTAVKLTASNNYTGTDVSLLMFTDYAKKDFHLLPASPLINAGANVLLYGVYYDFYGKLHTAANAFDIGATEY